MVMTPKQKLKIYKGELIIVAIASLLSITLLVISVTVNNEVMDELEQLRFKQAAQVRIINNLLDTQQMLTEISGQFESSKLNGFYGDEDRLRWAEALKDSALHLKLPHLKYSITPQKKIGELGMGFSPGVLLSQSIMDVEASLLHEGDLLSLSKALSAEKGLYRVLGCELEKDGDGLADTIQKNVSLKCALAWHTVKYDPVQDSVIEEDVGLGIE
jgi:hypothetical protein